MFKNNITLGNKNFLGNKDRKKLAINIKNTFNIEKDEIVDEILDKEDTSVCKVQKSKIIVYISKNIPVLFCENNVIFPTVYTLWKFPQIIPCFVIYPPASEFLLRGADLMIPGICKDVDDLEKLKVGNVWGVRVFNNPHIFAVGQCCIDYNNNKKFYNLKGKCLKLAHIYNDKLWNIGPQSIPHSSFKNKIIDSIEELVDNLDDFKIYNENKGGKKNTSRSSDEAEGVEEGEGVEVEEDVEEQKKKKKKKKVDFGFFSDEDDEEVGNDISLTYNDKNNINGKKENETKLKSMPNEKHLVNFYKHFNTIMKKRNQIKNGSSELKCSNASTSTIDDSSAWNKSKINEGVSKKKDTTDRLSDDYQSKKKECNVDLDAMEKVLGLNDSDNANKENTVKPNGNNSHLPVQQKKDNTKNSLTTMDINEFDQVYDNEQEIFSEMESSRKPSGSLAYEQRDDMDTVIINEEQRVENVRKKKEAERDDIIDEKNILNGSSNTKEEEVKHMGDNISNKNGTTIFELNNEQQDVLLLYSLLEALHSISDESLPLEVSGIYSRMTKEIMYILRNDTVLGELQKCNVPNEIINKIRKKEINLEVDVKKSSHKKLIKFIQYCSKTKLIKIKENRNVVSIVEICKRNPLYASYKCMSLSDKKKYASEGQSKSENQDPNDSQVQGQNSKTDTNTPVNNKCAQILEYYMPSSKTLNIFKCVDSKTEKNSYFNISQLRDVFKSYIKLQNLQNDDDMSFIKINEQLQSFLCVENISNNILPYDVIMNQFITAQQPCYAVIKPYTNFDADSVNIIKGVCPSIHIYAVARMKGKKYVTHITNLYLFHLDLTKFSDQVQKQLACSCSTVISPSTKKEEILVQGNVVNQIYNILISNYSFPKKYIVLNAK
ncbi:translation initiation factor SUI1, putative [Plasmodium malariae]|uniref:Translation initiation factor SUI1, putative n=1 Tax=Plasmodium malariae TaxID=5858 RepID=A0A1C3KBB6_PLAMA|nr:translation initiation factor SUI1, putative [Plasmodium malariae]